MDGWVDGLFMGYAQDVLFSLDLFSQDCSDGLCYKVVC